MKNSQPTIQESCTIYSLKPSWSRILDRVHTVGQTKQLYANSLATLVEQCEYPRLIATADERRSFSLDNKHQWITANWSKGWAVVNDSVKQATLYFAGDDGNTFHQVTLTPSSHWDCFECVLQMFSADIKQDQQLMNFQQMIQQNAINHTLNANVSELARKVNREIIRGVKLKCTLLTAGGVIKCYHERGSLMTKFGAMALSSAKSKISLNSAAIKHIDFSRKNDLFKGTFFDTSGSPQLIIEAV